MLSYCDLKGFILSVKSVESVKMLGLTNVKILLSRYYGYSLFTMGNYFQFNINTFLLICNLNAVFGCLYTDFL